MMAVLRTVEAMRSGGSKPVLFLLGSVVVASILLPYLIAGGQEAEPAAPLLWRTEIIDSDGDTGWYTSLALDPKRGLPRQVMYTNR